MSMNAPEAAWDADLLNVLSEIGADSAALELGITDIDIPDIDAVSLSLQHELAAAASTTTQAKPTRKRRKHEVDALRQASAELEAELERLKEERSAAMATPSATTGISTYWKKIAHRVALEKQVALVRNARLKAMMEQQGKLSEMMRQTLDHASDLVQQESRELGMEPPLPPSNGPSLVEDDAASQRPEWPTADFSDLFKSIHVSYQQRASIFKSITPTMQESRRVRIEMRSDSGTEAMCVQVTESRSLPFNYASVADATWALLARPLKRDLAKMHGGGMSWSFDDRGNELFGPVNTKFRVGDQHCCLLGNAAIRRYYEDGVIYLLWESITEFMGDAFTDRPLRLREQGWAALEQCEGDPSQETMFRTCVFITPLRGSSKYQIASTASEIGFVTEIVMSEYEESLGFLHKAVREAQAAAEANH